MNQSMKEGLILAAALAVALVTAEAFTATGRTQTSQSATIVGSSLAEQKSLAAEDRSLASYSERTRAR
jgi:hypothetical protein